MNNQMDSRYIKFIFNIYRIHMAKMFAENGYLRDFQRGTCSHTVHPSPTSQTIAC